MRYVNPDHTPSPAHPAGRIAPTELNLPTPPRSRFVAHPRSVKAAAVPMGPAQEWAGAGGGGGLGGGVGAYDFTLHSVGDPIPEEFTILSGTWEFVDDGGVTSLASTGVSGLIMWQGGGVAEGMDVVTVTKHLNTSNSWVRNGVAAHLKADPVGGRGFYRVGTASARVYDEASGTSETEYFAGAGIAANALVGMRLTGFPENTKYGANLWEFGVENEADGEFWVPGTDIVTTVPDFAGSPGLADRRLSSALFRWIGVSSDINTPAPLPGEVTPVNA